MATATSRPSVLAACPASRLPPPASRLWTGRIFEDLAAAPLTPWFVRRVAAPLDRWLISLSLEVLGTTAARPTALLTTTGARSGRPRTTPVVYFLAGDEVVVVASGGGSRRHPSWYHNLRAHPEATLLMGGHFGAYVAREACGERRECLWREVVARYAGSAGYQRHAGARRLPILTLSPVASTGRS